MHSVYSIIIKDVVYIGITKDVNRRIKEHIYSCYSSKSNAYDKVFYSVVRSLYSSKKEGMLAIMKGFTVLHTTSNRTEAKRLEMFIILDRYFKNKPLYQKIPTIRDR